MCVCVCVCLIFWAAAAQYAQSSALIMTEQLPAQLESRATNVGLEVRIERNDLLFTRSVVMLIWCFFEQKMDEGGSLMKYCKFVAFEIL